MHFSSEKKKMLSLSTRRHWIHLLFFFVIVDMAENEISKKKEENSKRFSRGQ